MAEADQTTWHQSSSVVQGNETHISVDNEPLDVVWVSGSAIAVAPRTNPTFPPIEYQLRGEPQRIVEENLADNNSHNEGTYESDVDSDGTIEYHNSPVEESVSESDEEQQQEVVSNLDENSVIIIQRENEGEQLVQEPNVVTVPENPTAGVENPIIRLENPDYEPEISRSSNSDSPRGTIKRSYRTMMSDEEDDGQTCPVCFDVWTNAGEHRLSSLKCGHLFGKSCIKRWLTQERKKYCPQCNKKASSNDIRELYATKLTALDCTEKNRLEKEIEVVKEQKRKLEAELMRCNLNIEMYKEQLEALKSKVSKLMGDSDISKKSLGKTDVKPFNKLIKYHLEKTLEITEGGCRVSAYDMLTNILVVSHQTRNQLFPGYGIKKIQKVGIDYFGNNFLYLHSKAIRDLSFHPVTPNLILTVSFDRTAKLTDIKEHHVLKTFKAEYPLWSCCWDLDDTNVFYTGAGNGCVYAFDIHNPSAYKTFFNPIEDSSAVVSLLYAPSKPPFKGGLICCRLNSITLYEKVAPNEYNPTVFSSLVGPFFSVCYDPNTQHILASCRPSQYPRVRHVYCELSGTECRKIHTFDGGTRQTFMSRSCFMKVNGETVVAAFQENSNSKFQIDLWSTSSGLKIQSIPVNDQILDLTSIKMENRNMMGAVSDSVIRFYEAPFVKP